MSTEVKLAPVQFGFATRNGIVTFIAVFDGSACNKLKKFKISKVLTKSDIIALDRHKINHNCTWNQKIYQNGGDTATCDHGRDDAQGNL